MKLRIKYMASNVNEIEVDDYYKILEDKDFFDKDPVNWSVICNTLYDQIAEQMPSIDLDSIYECTDTETHVDLFEE